MALDLDDKQSSAGYDDNQGVILTPKSHRSVSSLSRLNFLRIAMFGGFAVLGYRLWDLQKPFNPEFAKERQAQDDPARASDVKFITTTPPRGIIYDRNGKKLVSNNALYSVTVTLDALPDPEKAANKKEALEILKQRQEVYDNLARFLGMNYYLVIVPEQVNGLRNKQGQFTNPDRNAILNELETLSGVSAMDWSKRLTDLANEKRDKTLLIVNDKEPYRVEQFDRYKYLREKFSSTSGVYFISQGQLIMLESSFTIPPYLPVEVTPTITREDALWLDERRLDFPGVNVKTSYIRQYEEPRLYSHLLGYTGRIGSADQLEKLNTKANAEVKLEENRPANSALDRVQVYDLEDRVGATGVEAWGEKYLRGKKGIKTVRVDANGHILEAINEGNPVRNGSNLTLTIDSNLQNKVAGILDKWIDEANKKKSAKFKEGAAVVLDVNTGEVLAMVAFPFYNNNLYNISRNKWSDAEVKEMLDGEKSVETNRALSARYAPGSTFKLVTAAAVIQERKVNLNTSFDCKRYIQIPTTNAPTPSQPFRCWSNHGPTTVVDAIRTSCDIFFYNAAVAQETSTVSGQSRYYNRGTFEPIYFKGMGITPLNGYMELFNLGKPTGIEIPGEYEGTLPGPHTKLWSIGETMTTAIGQGDVETTPLQMAMLTATVANRGKLYQPKIVREVKDADGKVVVPFEPKLIRDITKTPVRWKDAEFRLDSWVLDTVRQGMFEATGARGTASVTLAGKTGNLKIAGKTGTAEYGEVIGKDDDGNDARATRAWFTSFAPFDKPQYAVTVLIATGDIGNEGSEFAVPAAKEIYELLYPELMKPPTPSPSPGANPPQTPATPRP